MKFPLTQLYSMNRSKPIVEVDGIEGEMTNLEKAEEAFSPSGETKQVDEEKVSEDSNNQESVDNNLEVKEPTK